MSFLVNLELDMVLRAIAYILIKTNWVFPMKLSQTFSWYIVEANEVPK